MSNGIPDNLKCASLVQVNELGKRVTILEMAVSRYELSGPESSPTRLELAENNLDACRKLNGELRKQVEALTLERDLLRKQTLELDLCERTTLENYRKVIKSLNLNGPGAIRKYVRELEDNVQRLLDKIIELEDARLTEDW